MRCYPVTGGSYLLRVEVGKAVYVGFTRTAVHLPASTMTLECSPASHVV